MKLSWANIEGGTSHRHIVCCVCNCWSFLAFDWVKLSASITGLVTDVKKAAAATSGSCEYWSYASRKHWFKVCRRKNHVESESLLESCWSHFEHLSVKKCIKIQIESNTHVTHSRERLPSSRPITSHRNFHLAVWTWRRRLRKKSAEIFLYWLELVDSLHFKLWPTALAAAESNLK